MSSSDEYIKPVLSKEGYLMIQDFQGLVMCKPRLIPLKSFTLEKLEMMQQQAEKIRNEQNKQEN